MFDGGPPKIHKCACPKHIVFVCDKFPPEAAPPGAESFYGIQWGKREDRKEREEREEREGREGREGEREGREAFILASSYIL